MTVFEGAKAFLQEYPPLSALAVESLPLAAGTFSLSLGGGETVLRTYLDGGSKRRLSLILTGRRGYGGGTEAADLRWFSDFTDWLELRGQKREFPQLGQGRCALEFSPAGLPELSYLGEDGLSCYEITLQLIYVQEGQYAS